jgi:hypothetical protein
MVIFIDRYLFGLNSDIAVVEDIVLDGLLRDVFGIEALESSIYPSLMDFLFLAVFAEFVDVILVFYLNFFGFFERNLLFHCA